MICHFQKLCCQFDVIHESYDFFEQKNFLKTKLSKFISFIIIKKVENVRSYVLMITKYKKVLHRIWIMNKVFQTRKDPCFVKSLDHSSDNIYHCESLEVAKIDHSSNHLSDVMDTRYIIMMIFDKMVSQKKITRVITQVMYFITIVIHPMINDCKNFKKGNHSSDHSNDVPTHSSDEINFITSTPPK